MRCALSCVLIVALAALAGPAQAGPGVWTTAGPTGGNVYDIEADPDAPATVIVNGNGGRLYRSTDAGLTWTALDVAPFTGFLSKLRMSPHDADILLVVGDNQRLFRTLDGGSTWTLLAGGLPTPASLFGVAFDPHTAGRLWVSGNDGLFRSLDNGSTWSAQATAGLGTRVLTQLAADPLVPDRLLAIGADPVSNESGIFRSVDGGSTWTAAAMPGALFVNGAGRSPVAFTATAGEILALANNAEVYRSVDGGANFASLGVLPLANPRSARDIVAHPSVASTWFVTTETGVARTTNGGATYSAIGSGIRPSGGLYANGVQALYVDPTTPTTLYAGADYTGFYASSDGGTSWSRRNTGLSEAAVRAVAVHPTQPLWVYAGYGDAFNTPSDGLFQSLDRGASWFSASPTLEASGLRSIVIDPNTAANPFSTTLYAAGYGSPLFALGGTVRDGNGGIYKSTNGGGTWTTIDTGIPEFLTGGYQQSWFSTARTIALDPSSGGPPGGTGPLQTLYLAGSGRITYDGVTGAPTVRAARIWKSVNAGASWTASDTGLPIPTYDLVAGWAHAVQVVPLLIDPATPTTLYAGTFTSLPETSGGVPEPLVSQGVINGVFKSTDGGATWSHSSTGLPRLQPANPDSPTRNVLAMALAASNPAVLYVAVNRNFTDAQVYKSTNAGASWTLANAGIAPGADIRVLIVDPTNPDVAYAGSTGSETNPGGVYRTLDGGTSWTSYSIGLPSSAALALELDRSGAVPRLYAGTRGGVYSIDQVPDEDLDGAPSAVEGGAPNGGDGNADGIPDTVQARVASLPGAGDPVRGGDSYVSVEVVPATGSCPRLENTHTLPAQSFPADPGRDYAFGLVRLDLGNCAAAQLRITYHGGVFDPAWRFRTYAPLTPDQPYTYAWRDLPATRVGSTWTITLADNALGDLRAAGNAILFQGGVAFDEVIFGNGFE